MVKGCYMYYPTISTGHSEVFTALSHRWSCSSRNIKYCFCYKSWDEYQVVNISLYSLWYFSIIYIYIHILSHTCYIRYLYIYKYIYIYTYIYIFIPYLFFIIPWFSAVPGWSKPAPSSAFRRTTAATPWCWPHWRGVARRAAKRWWDFQGDLIEGFHGHGGTPGTIIHFERWDFPNKTIQRAGGTPIYGNHQLSSGCEIPLLVDDWLGHDTAQCIGDCNNPRTGNPVLNQPV